MLHVINLHSKYKKNKKSIFFEGIYILIPHMQYFYKEKSRSICLLFPMIALLLFSQYFLLNKIENYFFERKIETYYFSLI